MDNAMLMSVEIFSAAAKLDVKTELNSHFTRLAFSE